MHQAKHLLLPLMLIGIIFIIWKSSKYLCEGKLIGEPIPCFNKIDSILQNGSVCFIDFRKEVDCFSWDSLELGARSSYEKFPCMRFKVVDKRSDGTVFSKNLILDWFDRDRHWQMIYFYKNGTILNNGLAISQSIVNFYEVMRNRYNKKTGGTFLKPNEAKFKITNKIIRGVEDLD